MDSTEKGKDYHGELERLLKEFSNSESPITLKMLMLEEFSKQILTEIMTNPDLEEKIDPLLATIEPTDFSAKRLKLEMANFLKRPEIIIDYIQTEEKLLIERALQFSWIFKAGASRLSNPKFLLEHLFPKVSYSVRTRIIHRLSRYLNDEKLCELMLKAIENKYGWSAVLPLIPSCSVEFIRPIMELNRSRLHLTDGQLLGIVKKDLNLLLEYLDLNSKTSGTRYSSRCSLQGKTIKYIIQKHPKEFIRLYDTSYEKFRIYAPSLNKKQTKVLIDLDMKTVIQIKGKTFSEILDKTQVMKSLQLEQMQDFLVLLFPEPIEKFKEDITDLLTWIQRYPSKTKLQIIRYGFQKVYGIKLSENLQYMTPPLLQLLTTEIEERDKIVDWKLETQEDCRVTFARWEPLPTNRLAFWYSFYGTEKAIGKIKELISIESEVTGRCELLPLLVNVCWYNGRDVKALTSVCKYVASRFRNDQYMVRHAFMKNLAEVFDLQKMMDKELFNVYLELIKFMILHEEPNIHEFLETAVKYSLKNHLPMDSYFVHFIKDKVSRSYSWLSDEWRIAAHDTELQKRFLILSLDCLAVTYPLERPLATFENRLQNTIIAITDCINKNTYGEKMSATDYPWLVGRIMEILENDCEDGDQSKKAQKCQIIYINNDSKARVKLYDDCLQSCPSPEVVNYFTRKDPAKLIANLDTVLLYILHQNNIKDYKSFFLRIKGQGFPDLSAKIVEKCLETAEDDSVDIVERRNAIRILPLLWETQNCLNLISYFYPPQSKVDITEENYEILFEMRKSIALSFSNLSFPAAAFQSLLRFCTGDYLKLTVNSLYSVCLHSPQSDAIRFLKEELLDRPVSVKKHTIRLVSKIALKEDIPEFLSYLWSENSNISIREAILVAMFQLLVDDPTQENWNMLKTTVETLSAQDKASLCTLVQRQNISAIPSEYLSSYLSTCWRLFNSIKSEDVEFIKSMKNGFINHLISDVEHIPKEFFDAFIPENLFHAKGDVSGMQSLAAEYFVIYEDRISAISAVFDQLDNYSRLHSSLEYVRYTPSTFGYDDGTSNSELVVPMYIARKATSNFIIELCNKSFLWSKKKEDELNSQELKVFLDKVITKLKAVLQNLQRIVPDSADRFSEEFFLKVSMIFFEQRIGDIPGDKARVNDKIYLHNVGKKLGKFFDPLVAQWNPSVVELICDNLSTFFEKCYTDNLMLRTEAVFLAHGILHCDSKISLENQLIISKLLPVISSREATNDSKYKELYSYIMTSSHSLVRVSFLNRLSKTY